MDFSKELMAMVRPCDLEMILRGLRTLATRIVFSVLSWEALSEPEKMTPSKAEITMIKSKMLAKDRMNEFLPQKANP